MAPQKEYKNTQMFQQACIIIINLCLQKIVFDLFIASNIILGIFILIPWKAITFLTQSLVLK